MKVPRIPIDEAERLAELERFGVMDSAAEAVFDDLARLAAHVLDTPIALVTFVDANRQWFKARYQFAATETARDVAFCAHVVGDDVPLVVHDAHQDPRFADNPLVAGEPLIRFYAGMPLRTRAGHVLGTLCAIDHRPRTPTEEQLRMLTLLADQVVHQLEARRERLHASVEREAARATAQRVTTLFSAMAEGVVVQNTRGEITDANLAAEEILGLTQDEMFGRTSVDPRWRSVHEDGQPFHGAEHPAMVALRTGRPVSNVPMGIHRPDGTLVWISINAAPRLEDGQAVEVISTFHDVTAIRIASERATQQERLATVGTLAAGVGHEINNPLAYVIGNLDVALEELRATAGPGPSARMQEVMEVLSEALEGAERIRRIVRGLRALVREDVPRHGVDARAVLENALGIAAHELRQRAAVTEDLTHVPLVMADEARLTQVLVNLLLNAAQAFERSDPSMNRIAVSVSRHADGRVRISVSDNGPGIPNHLLRRIFDPFFTTRPVGTGVGLGLSVSRNIVDALGGELQVESVEGHGATFHVLLHPAATAVAGTGSLASAGSPRARIMIIDDEASVVSSMRRVLAREHEVIGFSDPREALAALGAGDRFDLILCDLAMPYVSGEEVYARAVALHPEVADRFVFISGDPAGTPVAGFLSEITNEILEKPFAPGTLLRVAKRFVRAQRPSFPT